MLFIHLFIYLYSSTIGRGEFWVRLQRKRRQLWIAARLHLRSALRRILRMWLAVTVHLTNCPKESAQSAHAHPFVCGTLALLAVGPHTDATVRTHSPHSPRSPSIRPGPAQKLALVLCVSCAERGAMHTGRNPGHPASLVAMSRRTGASLLPVRGACRSRTSGDDGRRLPLH